jgi:hypothetical protein
MHRYCNHIAELEITTLLTSFPFVTARSAAVRVFHRFLSIFWSRKRSEPFREDHQYYNRHTAQVPQMLISISACACTSCGPDVMICCVRWLWPEEIWGIGSAVLIVTVSSYSDFGDHRYRGARTPAIEGNLGKLDQCCLWLFFGDRRIAFWKEFRDSTFCRGVYVDFTLDRLRVYRLSPCSRSLFDFSSRFLFSAYLHRRLSRVRLSRAGSGA